jgi:hypothetical protein
MRQGERGRIALAKGRPVVPETGGKPPTLRRGVVAGVLRTPATECLSYL